MYSLQNTFLISLFCISVTWTFDPSPSVLTNILQNSNTSNNLLVNAPNKTLISTNNIDKPFNFKQNASSPILQVASEGGIVPSTTGTHSGRENVLEHPAIKTNTIKTSGVITNLTLTKSEDIKPVKESVISTLDIAPLQDDEKPSVPKKGVSFSDLDPHFKSNSANATNKVKLHVSDSTNTNGSNVYKKEGNVTRGVNTTSNQTSATNATVIHKKPLVTESDSDFIDISKTKEDASKENAISIDQIDPLLVDKKSKRSDYIVPIVAVILSVPLVAILTSILYKRGTDWWQHRNYKRMDFLIEGMYHN